MLRAPLSALLALCVAAPSSASAAALGRASVPSRAASLPGGFVPQLGAGRLLPSARLTLPAASLGTALAPSLALTPAPLSPAILPAAAAAPSAPQALAAPQAVAAESAAPARAPLSAIATFEETLAASAQAPNEAPAAQRGNWEKVWSGAGLQGAGAEDAALTPVVESKPAVLPRSSGFVARVAPMAGAAVLPFAAAAPAAGGLLGAAMPFLQAGGLLLGAYVTARAMRWVVKKLAARYGWSANTLTLVRFIAGAGIWGAAAGYGLSLIGVADNVVLTTFGGSGAAMALAVKDTVGNLVHGVHFLFSRPFTVGSRVTIDDVPGTVHELTLRYVIVKTDLDPPYVYHTYSELTGKSITVHGRFEPNKAVRLRLRRPALPNGLLQALKDAASPKLWRPAIFSALGIAALSVLPLARAWFAHKGLVDWFSMALPWANFGLILFLARSLSNTAQGAISRLAQRYGWSAPATTLAKLGASVLIWGVAGSFALNAVGVSWASLATTLSISTIILGIAVNDYVTALFQAFLILILKPFQIGDRIAVGKLEGEVLDINFQHVVLKKDDESFILLPYASVKGFRSPRDGAKATR